MSDAQIHPGHVVLVGMMGTGKTTVGRLLAERLGRPFFDSDQMVEARTGHTVAELFEASGESGFRAEEAAALSAGLTDPTPSVIAAASSSSVRSISRCIHDSAAAPESSPSGSSTWEETCCRTPVMSRSTVSCGWMTECTL